MEKMEIEQLQKIVDSIHIGDFVSYRNHVYEITAFGRNRTTGKHYYVLDGELLVNEDNWNELKLEKNEQTNQSGGTH